LCSEFEFAVLLERTLLPVLELLGGGAAGIARD